MEALNKVVTPLFSQYAQASREFMESDLALSGLTAEQMGCVPDVHKPNTIAAEASASYVIAYFDKSGKAINGVYRRRIKYADLTAKQKKDRDKFPKYKQLPRSATPKEYHDIPHISPHFWKFELYEGGTVFILEGEKKGVAFSLAGSVPALSIPGCWNWSSSDEDGNRVVHPWIICVFHAQLDRDSTETWTRIP